MPVSVTVENPVGLVYVAIIALTTVARTSLAGILVMWRRVKLAGGQL